MKQKHLLVVSQYFHPELFRINDMCREWVKRGYKVTVLTGIPNYPRGKFYKGYGLFKKRKEQWNGVDIIRIPLVARGKTVVGLALNYLSFVVSGFFWKCFTSLRADAVFTFEVSPMTQALVGVWFAKRRKIPHLIYVQDLWPENLEIVAGIHSKLIIGPVSRMVNKIYKRSAKIFATSPSFVEEIRKRTAGEEEKVIYWPQYAEEFYVPLPKKTVEGIPDDERFKIIFTGNIGQAQGLEVLPRTAKLLKDGGTTDVLFVIIGDGRHKEALVEDIKAQDAEDMFCIIGRQPAETIPNYLAACDAAFVSFAKEPLFEKTIPAKLQSYMACGMPVVASATGETARVIGEAKCGVCCDTGNGEELARGIKELRSMNLTEMAQNARSYFEKHFSKQNLMDIMDGYFEDGIFK